MKSRAMFILQLPTFRVKRFIRVQDGDIAYIFEISKYLMVCNMKDDDGNLGGNFPKLENWTRVVGFFYNNDVMK